MPSHRAAADRARRDPVELLRQWNPTDFEPLFLGQHLPRNDVGVVLHMGEDDCVTLAEVGTTPRVGRKVQRFGGVLGEHHFACRVCIDELGNLRSRAFVCVGGIRRQGVRAATDRGVVLAHESGHGVDHAVGFVRRVGTIQIMNRLAAYLLGQHRKLVAERSQVERHGGYPRNES